ncbi:MAG: OmpA family protein [Bacteroidales bacterium]|nr:OmpA family protein [Bacteroidales bacterium]
MLKKLIKMGVVMSLLVTSVSAFAQNTGKAEYPRYSFWSNWTIGGGINSTWEMAQKSGGQWRRSINGGMDLFFMHKQNHAIDTRYRLSMPTFWRGLSDGKYEMARYATITADLMWSITNGLKGYDPDRRHSWYAYVGFGLGIINPSFLDDETIENTHYADKFGHVAPALNLGLGYSLRFTEKSSFYVEGEISANDIPDPTKTWQGILPNWAMVHATAHLGYMYCFGVTAADQAVAAQKSMLNQDNFGALNSQVATLEQQVANSKNEEKKLQRRINELEQQLADAMRSQNGKVNSAAADSLQRIIDQIKADQLNFYAMPFSVQYDVNEWKVSEEEMDKINAVARVMKDNSNIKICVVGFADYTGSDAYNLKLSERRANEVKRLLKSKGIADDRITVDFKGKNAPFGDAQYALNRRVSFYRVIE